MYSTYKSVNARIMGVFNPSNPDIHMQILQTDLHSFPLTIS